jgi:hypothetical protein
MPLSTDGENVTMMLGVMDSASRRANSRAADCQTPDRLGALGGTVALDGVGFQRGPMR